MSSQYWPSCIILKTCSTSQRQVSGLIISCSLIGPSSPPRHATSPQPPSSIFNAASSIAVAAGRRAAAIASPSASAIATFPSTQSTDRIAGQPHVDGKSEVKCVEGYGCNMYVGGSDGVVEWWVCDGVNTNTQVGLAEIPLMIDKWMDTET
jgi:hypothetical protein